MKTNENTSRGWNVIREAKLARNRSNNGGACEAQLYGCLGFAEDVHHVVARIDGGGDNDSNLMAVCSACHYRYTTETVQQRAKQRAAQRRAKKRRNHPGRKDRYDGEGQAE